jgi:hypothetical protein
MKCKQLNQDTEKRGLPLFSSIFQTTVPAHLAWVSASRTLVWSTIKGGSTEPFLPSLRQLFRTLNRTA